MEKAGVFQPIELKLYLDKCECSSVKVKFIPNQINNLVNFCPARYNCIRVDSIVNILFASVQVVLCSHHLRRGEDYEDDSCIMFIDIIFGAHGRCRLSGTNSSSCCDSPRIQLELWAMDSRNIYSFKENINLSSHFLYSI